MPKKLSLAEEIAGNPAPDPPAAAAAPPRTAESRATSSDILERLDEIALHLKRMDRRDRLRMISGTIRSLLALSILIFTIWSSVYLLQHMDDIIKMTTQAMASQAMDQGKAGSEGLMQQLQQMMLKK